MAIVSLVVIGVLIDFFLLGLIRDQRKLTRVQKGVRKQNKVFKDTVPPCEELTAWLSARESQYPDMRPGNAAKIVWADGASATALVVIYLHGFSASPAEISPVGEQLAAVLGANFYAPRLTGHGLDSVALGAATAEDWLADTWQSWAIAKTMGARIIIVASSTGATLATQLLQQETVRQRVAAVLYLSPNFGVTRSYSSLLNWPLGVHLIKLKTGSHWEWRPENTEQARVFTFRYPISVLHQVQRLVFWTTRQSPRKIKVPLAVFYCEKDKTVSAVKTKRFLAQWPSPITWFQLSSKVDNNNHVLAGNAVRPENNDRVLAMMVDFLTDLKVI